MTANWVKFKTLKSGDKFHVIRSIPCENCNGTGEVECDLRPHREPGPEPDILYVMAPPDKASFPCTVCSGSGVVSYPPLQYIKTLNEEWACNLETGELNYFDDDESVYPIDVGWVAELNCYGFKIPRDLTGPREVLAYIFSRWDVRKNDEI